ncbi:hypothetical protein BGX34_006254, partial [Mortierella sp. NVP85]
FGSVQDDHDGENLVNVREQLASALMIFEERMAAERENEDEVAEYTVEDHGEDHSEDNGEETDSDVDTLEESLGIVRNHIFADPYAMRAKAIKLESGHRVMVFAPNVGGKLVQQLEFYIQENDLLDWKERHQKLVGVDFLKKNEYGLKVRHNSEVGELRSVNFECHCSGKKRPAPSNANTAVQGEPSKKRRKVQTVSIKQDCQAKLNCVLQERLIPNGSPVRVWRIRYNFQHSHPLANDDRVGTQHLSTATKQRIDILLQTRSPVRDVLYRMRARATKIAQLDKKRVFRDDIITCEDAYNSFYKKMAKRRKRTRTI